MNQVPTWSPAASGLPAPGWYPDPSRGHEYRFWDGREWTTTVADQGQVSLQARPGAPAPASGLGWVPARAALVGLAGFGAGMGIGLVLVVLGLLVGLPDAAVLALGTAGLWAGLIRSCQVASRRYGTGSLRSDFGLGFRGSDLGFGVVMSLAARAAVMIVTIPFLFGPDSLTGEDSTLVGDSSWDPWTFAVLAVIALIGAPLVEELFFRGLLQSSLTTAIGVPAAIAAQAVLFGLAHASPLLGLANFSVVLGIAAAGLVFGVTAWWRKRLTTSILAHSLFNIPPILLVLSAA